jgi:di/tricarboxylate transporter
MTWQLTLVLGLLAACIAMFIANRPRMDVVALLAVVALPLCKVISVNEALAGFSDTSVVLVAAFFVVGDGLVRTGIANRLGNVLMHYGGQSEGRLIALLMLMVGALGSVMSSTGVVAIFIPAVLAIAQRQRIGPEKLMMPLSMASLISGMLTLVATAPNLVADSALRHAGFAGFGFFTFTPFGAAILAAGIGYMMIARRWLKPHGDDEDSGRSAVARRRNLMDFVGDYRLAAREHRFRIEPGSPLAGKTLAQLPPRHDTAANVVAIERLRRGSGGAGGQRDLIEPSAETQLQAGDVLLVDFPEPVDERRAPELAELKLELLPLRGSYFTDQSRELGMAEVMLPPDSDLIGKSVAQSAFRSRYQLNVIGLRRGRDALEGGVSTETLRVGDVLLVIGRWKRIRELQKQTRDFLVLGLPAEIDQVAPARKRAPLALLCVALMVTLMVGGWVPNVLAALIGCLLLGLTRCVTLDSAYRSVQWPSLILIVGMMPFSIALQKTGGVELAAQGLLRAFGRAEPRVLLAALFTMTALIGLFISNTATAVLMSPIALTLARDLAASPHPFVMTVALASSTAFMTPVSTPVNTLVMVPGKYRFGDFVKVGLPFSIVTMALTVVLVPWVLPMRR